MTSYQRYQVGEVNMARKKFSCRQYYVSFCISPGVAHCLLISLSCVHWKKENESISELKKTNFKTFSLQRKVDVGKIFVSTVLRKLLYFPWCSSLFVDIAFLCSLEKRKRVDFGIEEN